MIFDDLFSRVLVISMARTPERGARARADLLAKNLSESPVIMPAVDGREMGKSAWWPGGNGSWGCLQSHYLAVLTAFTEGIESLLVIEDDCVWQPQAAAMAAEFMKQVPDDWGQIYFGGQHRGIHTLTPLDGKPAVMRPSSIHRTHCYAIHRRAMAAFLRHISYAPDYIETFKKSGIKPHVDHQLEVAHRRRDWPVYAPTFWLAGQGENQSLIMNRREPERWWHVPWRDNHLSLPLVITDIVPSPQILSHLHFGNHLVEGGDPWVDVGVRDCKDKGDLLRIVGILAGEGYANQRLPSIPDIGGGNPMVEWVSQKWKGPVIRLSDLPDLEAIRDFPMSKVVHHPWFHPSAERIVVSETTESTEQVIRAHPVSTVHQVWIGGNELPPRLAAYCAGIEKAFPDWGYRLWTEADMVELAESAVMPQMVRGEIPCNIGLRADIVRLEILRQHGGVYFDCDIEALRPDLRPLFQHNIGFTYADYFNGGPGNQVMAAAAPENPVVCLYLERIARAADLQANSQKSILKSTGPDRLKEVLNFYVGKWDSEKFETCDQWVGNIFASGMVVSLFPPIFFPYWFTQGTWATFDPQKHPHAWGAHHWDAAWMGNLEPEQ